MRKPKPRPNHEGDFAFRADEFVAVAGEPASFQIETDSDPLKVDHVWITIRAGRFGRLLISINTLSLKHAADGFDPRIRVGLVAAPWTLLPENGVFPSRGLDYGELERAQPIIYAETERPDLEEMLREKTDRAICLEAWGALFLRDRLGIHQVHSRRASCSVRSDHVGRDGAVRFFYREDSASEMLLFKYCGQV